MQVIFEDYISRHRQRLAIWTANTFFIGLALGAVIFLVQI
jgi:succinate dehydrogenase hydrophobic anchor subunit